MAAGHRPVSAWGWQGLSFVFTAADPYADVDLEGCRDPETGEIAPWAWEIVGHLASYTEVSPSGRGLHILVKAALPDHSGCKHDAVEIYDHQRYFAVTGERLAGTSATLEERQAEVLALYATLAPVEEAHTLPCVVQPVQVLSRTDEEVLAWALAGRGDTGCRTAGRANRAVAGAPLATGRRSEGRDAAGTAAPWCWVTPQGQAVLEVEARAWDPTSRGFTGWSIATRLCVKEDVL